MSANPTANDFARRKAGTAGLGGAMQATEISDAQVHNLFRQVLTAEAELGVTLFRCWYFYNKHTSKPLKNVVMYFSVPVTNSSITMSIGRGTSAIDKTSVEQTIATETTLPSGVTFKVQPVNRTAGLALEKEVAGTEHAAIWMRMVVPVGTQPSVFTHYKIQIEAYNLDADANIPENFGISLYGFGNCAADTNTVISRISSRGSSLAIAVGNTPDVSDPSCWITSITNAGQKPITKYVFGRLEDATATKRNTIQTSFGLSTRYYSLKLYNVFIVVMDFETSYSTSNAQYNWLVSTLQTARNTAGVDWIFVIANDAMYLSPSSATRNTTTSFRDLYHPIFMQRSVHMVISGSAPRYERQGVLKFFTTQPNNPALSQHDLQTPNYEWFSVGFEGGASLFVNVGTAGQSHIAGTTPANYYTKKQSTTEKGYLHLQFSNFGSEFSGSFYTTADVQVDSFSMKKTLPP
jgi:hypothetical protein